MWVGGSDDVLIYMRFRFKTQINVIQVISIENPEAEVILLH